MHQADASRWQECVAAQATEACEITLGDTQSSNVLYLWKPTRQARLFVKNTEQTETGVLLLLLLLAAAPPLLSAGIWSGQCMK